MSEIFNLNVLCRCCLKDGYFRDMNYPYVSKEGVDVYSAWLRETFGITLETPYALASNMICEDCISRLRDARQFRRQVEDSELKFQRYCTNEGHVKEEPPDDDLETDKLQENAPIEDKDEVKLEMEIKLSDDYDNCEDTRDSDDHTHDFDDPSLNRETPTMVKVKEDKKINPIAKTTQKRPGNTSKCLTKIVCHICQKTFKEQRKFDHHVKRVHGKFKIGICDYCKKEFTNRMFLMRHIRRLHLNQAPAYPCHVCGHMFYNVTYARHHVQQVHEKLRPYQCEYCVKSFKAKKALTEHTRRKHTKETPYVCHICTAGFVTGYELNLHVKAHYKEKEPRAKRERLIFKCVYCKLRFKTRKIYQDHIFDVHGGKLPYPCSLCDKSFVSKYTLKTHSLIHSESYVECDICKQRFKHERFLRDHKKRIHVLLGAQSNSEKQNENYTKCDVCKCPVFKHRLEAHRKTHFDRPFQCEKCKKSFGTTNALRRHKYTHVRVLKYKCDLCPKKFMKLGGLNRHRKKKHPEAPSKANYTFKIDYEDVKGSES